MMRLSFNLLSVISILLLLGCINSCESRKSSSDASDAELQMPDTLVYSFPVNYSQTLEALDDSSKVEVGSYKDVLELFGKLNYTPESWQTGIREVPRAYLVIIGDRWGSSTTKEITVLNKKQLFFRGIAPLILNSNELILKDRSRLERIRSSLLAQDSIPETDHTWILKLADLYKIKSTDEGLTATELDELWLRVDVVPPSLALAQAAEESGWGTSRFAAQGNAVYGQWTWGKNAIKPEQQREGVGKLWHCFL